MLILISLRVNILYKLEVQNEISNLVLMIKTLMCKLHKQLWMRQDMMQQNNFIHQLTLTTNVSLTSLELTS